MTSRRKLGFLKIFKRLFTVSFKFSQNGFTLVEIVIVITVISIISSGLYATIISPSVKQRTGDANRMQDLQQIKSAIELYYHDHNCYPTASDTNFSGALSGGTEWHDTTNTSTVYMRKVPLDPDKTAYTYKTDSASTCPQWMVLYSKLSKAPSRFVACPLPIYVKSSTSCVPTGFDTTWGCVSSGTVSCNMPTPTPTGTVAATNTPTPTSAPSGQNPPCYPPGDSFGYGDVDANTKVNTSDTTAISFNGHSVSNAQDKRADVNGDSVVNSSDQSLISTFVSSGGTFPVCATAPTATPTPTPGTGLAQIGWWKLDDGSGTTAVDSAGTNNGTLSSGTPTTSGLNAWWKLDEATATSATDSSGNNLTGTSNGTTVVTHPNFGNARSFNGTSDYIGVTDNALLRLSTDLTVALFFKTSASYSSYTGLLRKDSLSGTRYLWGLDISNQYSSCPNVNKVVAEFYNGSTGTGACVASTNTVNDGAWHHAAMTFSTVSGTTTMKLYIDGNLQGSTPLPGPVSAPNGEMDIGVNPPYSGHPTRDGPFNGSIDDVRIYNRALSQTEIQTLVSNGGTLPAWGAGYIGSGSLNFDGSGGWVDLGSSASLRPSGPVSVSAWVKPSATQPNYPIIMTDGETSKGINLYLFSDGRAAFRVKENGFLWGDCEALGGVSLKDNTWHHVVGVYGGTDIRIYVDNVLKNTKTCNNVVLDYGTSPRSEIGRKTFDPVTYFNGTIDDVRLYNYALNQTEVTNLYNMAPTPTPTLTPSPTPICSNGYLDNDMDGYGTGASQGCYAHVAANNTDCNDNNDKIYQTVSNIVTDADQDGYYVTAPNNCVGASLTLNSLPSTTGLYANWHLDDASGTTASDSTGNGNLGTLTNSPTWTTGKIGGGLNFSGSAWVNLGANKSYAQNRTAISVAGFMNTNSATQAQSVLETSYNNGGLPSATSRVSLSFSANVSNEVGCTARSADGGDSAPTTFTTTGSGVVAGQWNHIACVINYSTKNTSIYVNGFLKGGGTPGFISTVTPNTTDASSAIGSQDDGSSQWFNGKLDELYFYTRTLTQPEMSQLANYGRTYYKGAGGSYTQTVSTSEYGGSDADDLDSAKH